LTVINNTDYFSGLLNRRILGELQDYTLKYLIAEGNPHRLADINAQALGDGIAE
jgi:hypothetical protein